MDATKGKAPWHLWVVGVFAVLFNSIGVFDFVMSMAQGESYMAKVGMTPEQIAHYRDMPAWMTLVWAVGVWGAFLASLLLLARRGLAFLLFVVSLAAFVVAHLRTGAIERRWALRFGVRLGRFAFEDHAGGDGVVRE